MPKLSKLKKKNYFHSEWTFDHWTDTDHLKVSWFRKQIVKPWIFPKINEFVFTTLQGVFVCFLEEIEDTKKTLSKLPHLYKAFVLSIVQLLKSVKGAT
jgi:hypothetical protein